MNEKTLAETNGIYSFLPFIFVAILLSFIVFLIIWGIRKWRYHQVKRFSTSYQQLCEINQRYNFHYLIQPIYHLTEKYDSKLKLERADIDARALQLMYNDYCLGVVCNQIKENRNMFRQYICEVKAIPETPDPEIDSSHISRKHFYDIENELCENAIQNPPRDINISICFSYTSPQGRNRYERNVENDYNAYVYACTVVPEEQTRRMEKQTQRQIERSKMTNSLRYDVMRRDGFRCVLCGAKASDGITLHVDHIYPVSKGGKTELNNLRTLCDRCNFGKRDKYDYNGLN